MLSEDVPNLVTAHVCIYVLTSRLELPQTPTGSSKICSVAARSLKQTVLLSFEKTCRVLDEAFMHNYIQTCAGSPQCAW